MKNNIIRDNIALLIIVLSLLTTHVFDQATQDFSASMLLKGNQKSSYQQAQNLTINSVTLKKSVQHAITYRLENWRRLGDTILTYTKAKLLSYAYNLDFLYKEFSYSDQFFLHKVEKQFTPEIQQTFSKTIEVLTLKDLENNLASDEPILFECQFLTQTPWPYIFSRENPNFENHLKEMLTPINPLQTLPKPPAVISVAVHVRKGGALTILSLLCSNTKIMNQ